MAYIFEKYTTGGGSGGGSGIIDVTELPTENIDEQSIYRVANEGSPKVYMYLGAEGSMTLPDDAVSQGMVCEVVVVADKDDIEMQSSSMDNGNIYFYIDESENGIAYVNVDGVQQTAAEFFYLDASWNKGWLTTDLSNAEFGVYSARGYTYTYHANKDGMWTELSNTGTETEVVNIGINNGIVTGLSDKMYDRIASNPYNVVLRYAGKLYRCSDAGGGVNAIFTNVSVINGSVQIANIDTTFSDKTATHSVVNIAITET